MQEILNVKTNDLFDNQLEHETIDLGSSNLDTQSINLQSSSLDPTALNPIRLSELEKAVDLLKSFGIVRYDANQNLTDKQKKQVKDNIGITDSGEILINTTEYWNSKLGYIPPAGTIIIYTDKGQIDGKAVPGIKIGSGNAYIQDLAFVSEEIENILLNHVDNSNVHVSLEDKSKWNNKVNIDDRVTDVDGETIIFTRAF